MLKKLFDSIASLSTSSATEPVVVEKRSMRQWFRWLWENIVEIAYRTDGDHAFMLAAGIAFNIITSLVPTVLVLLFVLGYLLDSESVVQQLNYYAETFLVAGNYRNDIMETFRSQISSIVANRGLAGIFGVIGLMWTASALASSIRLAINRVLRCREERNYFIYKLYDFAAIALIGLLIFLSILVGPLLQVVLATSDKIAEAVPLLNLSWFIPELVNLALTLILFYTIFRYMPYHRQERHIIWIGALVSTFLWELARYVFGFYLVEFKTFSRIYGAYAFFAAVAFWIYYTSLVFLIGAEIAYHIKQSRWNARRTFNRIAEESSSKLPL